MRINKIIILLLLLLTLISAVNAEDNETVILEETSVNDDIPIQLIEEEVISEKEPVKCEMNITVPDKIIAGEYTDINVTLPEDASGQVIVYKDAEVWQEPAPVNKGKINITYFPDDFKKHNFKVRYSGDDKYAAQDKTFSLKATDYTIRVECYEMENGKNDVEVHFPDEVKGTITLTVNGKKYTKKADGDWVYYFTVNNLKYGENPVTVKYSGDKTFKAKTIKTTIPKYSEIEIPSAASYNGDDYVYLKLPNDAKGKLILNIEGKEYSSDFSKGEAKIIIPDNLTLGTHEIKAEYTGSDYKVKTVTANITVKPKITYPEKVYKTEDVNIEVVIPDNLNGTITLNNQTVNISNGKGNIKTKNILINKEIEIRTGNYTYKELIQVTVSNRPHDYDILPDIPEKIIKGEYLYIDIFTYEGNLSCLLDGEKYSPEVYADEVVITYSIPTSKLSYGKHTLKAIFTNSTNYYKSYNKTYEFTIVPVDVVAKDKMTLSDDLAIFTEEGLTGTITVTIDGKQYKKYNLKNYDSIFIPFESMKLGVHDFQITYSGDKKHSKITENYKINITYSIDVTEEWFGGYASEDIDYIFFAPMDFEKNITATINGKTYNVIKDMENTEYRIEKMDLNHGINQLTLTYPGDSKYYPQSVNITLYAFSEIDMIDYLMYGEEKGITLKLPSDAKGKLIVIINNQTNEVEFENGTAYYSFSNLKPGEYWVNAYYDGDDYMQNEAYDEIDYYKYSSSLFVAPYVNTTTPKYTENGTVTIRLPSNAQGEALIKLGGKTYTAELINGTANATLPVLPVGLHYFTVEYAGYGQIIYQTYEINVKPVITVPETIKVHGKDTVNITGIQKGSSASLSIYTEPYNMVYMTSKSNNLQLPLNKLSVGLNELRLEFYSADGYCYFESFNITVEKLDKPQIVEDYDLTMYYCDGSVYSVCIVDENGTGISNEKVVFKLNGKTHNVKTDENGNAVLKITKLPKKYTVTATWKNQTVKNKITVKKILTLKKIKVKKSAKKLVLTATLKKALKGKKITFKFNGKKYTAKTNKKGVAKVTVKKSVLKKLKIGKKVNYQATYVKTTVKNTVKVQK